MAEDNINEVLGIEEETSQTHKANSIFDNEPNYETTLDQNTASKGLRNASNICQVFLWLGIILAVIGGLVFLANIGDANSSYPWAVKYQARCAVGSTCFVYGIAGALFSYVFSKILIGLSVITKASEIYLSEKK